MTWVDVAARARGLSTRLAPEEWLAAIDRAPDAAALRAAVAAAGYDVEAGVEAALARRATDELGILVRWADDRARALSVIVDDEDRQSLRALLRGLVAGLPVERRLATASPTPRLTATALRDLAEQPSAAAFGAALARLRHPFAGALAPVLAREPVNLLAIELALARAFATRARRARGDRALALHVAETIDGDNAASALLLAARGRDLDAAACFEPGGHRLGRATYLAAARTDVVGARVTLAAAFRGTPLDKAVRSSDPAALEPALLEWQLATQERLRRVDPTGLAAVLWFVLRRRREVRRIRRAAWRLALGGPP